ncbi:MAG: Unknown protein [uncultured Sulfurovum sp.]|uniref:YafQ toxin protein n=1 Tax=uncultured Sulfurovum sp. TaxID=269237 RepID=A0A6S6SQE6_9BACT|nr:MAG: Unknown protein [uncultured Sulfurovum sp.]
MLELERTKIFKRDIAKLKFSNQHYSKYVVYLEHLLNEKVLPKEARDHSLNGTWHDYRELHISGDLLLVYKIEMGTVYLARIGTHSQIFN